ncbi:MAG: hypothetical protein KBS83_02885 [Lachnospiraceae bacterium]|nr:hypothetical protein [Candidatus Equihabitans merdae]
MGLFGGNSGEEPTPEEISKREKSRSMLYIIAGGYLVYIGYGLVKDTLADPNASRAFVAGGVLFGIIGIFFVFNALKGFMARPADSEEEADAEAQAETETEEAAENATEKAAVKSSGSNSGMGGLFEKAVARSKVQQEELESFKKAGSDIRDRLRKINEMDGVEMEDVTPEAAEDTQEDA